ncbi:MAG: DUF2167 domain-containing protein [Pseudomonadota bacterium]
MRTTLPRFTVLAGLLVVGTLTLAQEASNDATVDELPPEAVAQLEQMQAFLDGLTPRNGAIPLGDNLVTLTVPDDFNFYGSADAQAILVDAWGNPPDGSESTLGLLMPTKYTPFDRDSWAVTIEYVEDGYVSDEDAASIDYDELLRDMQRSTRESNDYLRESGYATVELLGWAEPPHYDASTRKLYWAKELMFEGADESTLNYDIRALGRRGVLSMTFIAATAQLDEINASRDAVLAMAQFTPGNRYSDFDPSIDKVAAYGIGALVGGKLAAKAGLFAAALLLLKKFWFVIVIAVAAIGRFAMRLLGGRTDTLEPPNQTPPK